jgi:LacI family transcriptional regulator
VNEKPKRPNIFDLVKRTGFSRGTISRACNNQPGINAGTREAVLKAAREIGYQPHSAARMMKLNRKSRWGLLLPHLKNPYYAELVEALNKEARSRRTTLLFGLSLTGDDAEAVIEQWAAETDGLIADQSYYREHGPLFDRLRERGMTMLFLHGTPIPGYDFVKYDLYDSFKRNLRNLFALGHTRIAYAGQEFPGCRQTGRFRAYADSHAEKGMPLNEELICFGEDGHLGGIAAWQRCAALPDPPTAVVCADDIVACGVVQAARAQGLQLPRDLSVSGNDDIAEAERLALTTVHTDRDLTSRTIFDLLERRLADPKAPPQVATIPSQLIMRDSVGSPRTHALVRR